MPQYLGRPLLLLSKHRRLVWLEVQFELFVLQLVLLEAGVQLLDHLAPGQPLALPGADDLGEVGGDVQLGVVALRLVGFHLEVCQCGTTLSVSVSEKSGAGAQCRLCHQVPQCPKAPQTLSFPPPLSPSLPSHLNLYLPIIADSFHECCSGQNQK